MTRDHLDLKRDLKKTNNALALLNRELAGQMVLLAPRQGIRHRSSKL